MKKSIFIDKNAQKELQKFPRPVQIKFQAAFELLEELGKLEEPLGKKLSGHRNLFEIRIRYQGQWRSIYSYLEQETIIILSAFVKKTQKTESKELEKAIKRLQLYKE